MGAGRFEWERAIRVLDLRPPTRKLVALMVATYADKDGGNAHPGEDRLAAECGITARAVRGHLEALRQVGLLERTFRGSSSGRRKLADCYALNMPADIIQRVALLSDTGEEHRNLSAGTPEIWCRTPEPQRQEHRNPGSAHQPFIKDGYQPRPICGFCDLPPTGRWLVPARRALVDR